MESNAMMNPEKNIYEEVANILRVMLECAESLHATSAEMQSLLNTGRFEQVQDRFVARGEILDLMVSMDRRLTQIVMENNIDSEAQAWKDLFGTAKQIKDLLSGLLSMDLVHQDYIQQKCDEIGRQLNALRRGSQHIKNYAQEPHAIKQSFVA